jgi:hypothetical protein
MEGRAHYRSFASRGNLLLITARGHFSCPVNLSDPFYRFSNKFPSLDTLFNSLKGTLTMPKELANFKYAPTKSLPSRPGPVQCVRNCTRCILNSSYDEDADVENLIAIKSYDDLVQRKSLWISKYQTIQYHLGQVDVLKQSLRIIKPDLVIYAVAATRFNDLDYFRTVLNHEKMPRARVWSGNFELDSKINHIIVPIRLISCFTKVIAGDGLIEANEFRAFLDPLVNKIDSSRSSVTKAIVPVTISKDHDLARLFGMGSICVQIMQPYPMNDYLNNAGTLDKTSHLVQHIYHDLSRYSARLPTHVVALLLVYLDRPHGVSREDLIDYMDWFRRSSMEFDLHMAFTGESIKAIEFALLVLEDYVQYDATEFVYRPRNIEALTYYASGMISNFAYFGLISKTILVLHNRNEDNTPLARFSAEKQIKVMKDDLLELAQDMAEKLDSLLPCRRPCVDISTALVASFNSMMTFGKYFSIREAYARPNKGLGWLGDYDSDEEYFLSKRDDPAFKPWVLLTRRPYRLDRLNLLMNTIEAYLELIVRESQ